LVRVFTENAIVTRSPGRTGRRIGEQRDRKAQLEAAAWRIPSSNCDFLRSREANAALAASSPAH